MAKRWSERKFIDYIKRKPTDWKKGVGFKIKDANQTFSFAVKCFTAFAPKVKIISYWILNAKVLLVKYSKVHIASGYEKTDVIFVIYQ